MNTLLRTQFVVLILAGLLVGCIPSEPKKPEQPEAAAPAPAAAEAPEVIEDTSDVPEPETVPAPDENDAKPHVHVSLDPPDQAVPGTPMPTVRLLPMEDRVGFTLDATFPVDGLDVHGTLVYNEPNTWRLEGHFISDTDAFKPSEPSSVVLGHAGASVEPGEDGYIPDGTEIMIKFDGPMPPPDAPKLDEPIHLPFELDVKATRNNAFMVFVFPF